MRWRQVLLWSGLILMVILGVISAIGRILTSTAAAPHVTEWRLETSRSLLASNAAEVPLFEQHFADSPLATLVHAVTGGLFLAFGVLQFSSRLRTRWPRWHRWSGRSLVALAIAAGGTGIWLGVVSPYSPTERMPSLLAGLWFVITPIVGLAAIRRGDRARHREWMIRFFAVAIGVVVIRLIGPIILVLMRPLPFRDLVGITFWTGWLIAAAAGEARIRLTRELPARSIAHAPAG